MADDTYLPSQLTPGSTKRVNWKCSLGHEWITTPNSRFDKKTGTGCPYCSGNKVLPGFNDLPTTHPNLVALWNDDRDIHTVSFGSGYGAQWKCSRGHEFENVVHQMVKNDECRVCSGRRIVAGVNDLATTHPHLVEEWHPSNKRDMTSLGYGSAHKVQWICAAGHEWTTTVFARAKEGAGCAMCKQGRRPVADAIPEEYRSWYDGDDFDTLTEGSHRHVDWTCPNGHKFNREVKQMLRAVHPCGHCGKVTHIGKSAAEFEIQREIESWGFEVSMHNKGIIPRYELDLYIPSEQTAIEHNGLYWHSEPRIGRTRHHEKYVYCKEAGIRLFTIWGDDWIEKRDVVLAMLKNELFDTPPPKTEVHQINADLAEKFLDENHILGSAVGMQHLGLFHGDDLIGAGAFTEHDDHIVLERYAGFAGGLEEIIRHLPNKKITAVVGNDMPSRVFDTWGVKEDMAPDFHYLCNKKRQHKNSFTIERFQEDPELLYRPGKSVKQHLAMNGIKKIFDAGSTRFARRPANMLDYSPTRGEK